MAETIATQPPASTEAKDTTEPLERVDSAVQGLSSSPPTKERTSSRRKSSINPGVFTMKQLWKSRTPIKVAEETQVTGWKINTELETVDEDIRKKLLVEPPVQLIHLYIVVGRDDAGKDILFKLPSKRPKHGGGYTIEDALRVIYDRNKDKDDDELLSDPYLAGFEWIPADPNRQDEAEKEWDRLYVHFSPHSTAKATGGGGGKKKNKKKDAE